MGRSLKTMEVRFSTTEDEALINFISDHPTLYDSRLEDYKNQSLRDSTWKQISDSLNKTATQCKIRWKSIRDHYRKQKKIKQQGGEVVPHRSRCSYWELLSFLDSIDDDKRGFQNMIIHADIKPCITPQDSEDNSLEIDTDPNTISGSPINQIRLQNNSVLRKNKASSDDQETSSRKRLRIGDGCSFLGTEKSSDEEIFQRTKVESYRESDCEIDLFFRGIAATVKKFPPRWITDLKMKVFSQVNDLELKYHASNSGGTLDT